MGATNYIRFLGRKFNMYLIEFYGGLIDQYFFYVRFDLIDIQNESKMTLLDLNL